MEFCHLELELSGHNKEVAALHSDHCVQVCLYTLLQACIWSYSACYYGMYSTIWIMADERKANR